MRVLVIEDEKTMAAALQRGLTAAGFSVDVVHDGVEGHWMAAEQPYDAIVLDLMLPGMNGYDVCAALRKDGVWTPILMLTAKAGELDETEGLDTGADDYLTKPFSYPVLLARLRALLRRGAPERPAILRAGDLALDPAERKAWRGTDELDLRPKEFAVLEFLMRRAGQVVSRTELLDHAWDFAYDGTSNVVEVNILTLRRKIDDPFGRHSIETVRGAGYRLAENGG
jgi:two-component system, OmpR family, response regulator